MSDQYKHLVIIPTLALESTLMRTFGAFYKYSESNTLFVVSVNPHKMEDAKKNIEALKGLIGAQALLSPKENVTIEYVWSDEPIGFGAAVNKGYEFAKENYGIPEYITIANDDLHVTPGWMESLASSLETKEVYTYSLLETKKAPFPVEEIGKIGITGPLSPGAYGESGLFGRDFEWVKSEIIRLGIQAFSTDWRELHGNRTILQNIVYGFCIMLKRDCAEDLAQNTGVENQYYGPFDDVSFPVGGYEDNDLCLRAQEMGWRSSLSFHTVIGHMMHQTLKEIFPGQYHGTKNLIRYMLKWEEYTQSEKNVIAAYRVSIKNINELIQLEMSVTRVSQLVDGISFVLTNNPADALSSYDNPMYGSLSDENKAIFDSCKEEQDSTARAKLLEEWILRIAKSNNPEFKVRCAPWGGDFNERDERNLSYQIAHEMDADYIFSVDGDEVPEDRISKYTFRRTIHHPDPDKTCGNVSFLNHWENTNLIRTDYPFANGYTSAMAGPRIWRVIKKFPQKVFAGTDIGLHCGNCPEHSKVKRYDTSIRMRHLSHVRSVDRADKFKFYQDLDKEKNPKLVGLDGNYSHIVRQENVPVSVYNPRNGIAAYMLAYEDEIIPHIGRWFIELYGICDRLALVWTGKWEEEDMEWAKDDNHASWPTEEEWSKKYKTGPSWNLAQLMRLFRVEVIHKELAVIEGGLGACRNAAIDHFRQTNKGTIGWVLSMDPDEIVPQDQPPFTAAVKRMAEVNDVWGWMFRFTNPTNAGDKKESRSETIRMVKLDDVGLVKVEGSVHEGYEKAFNRLMDMGIFPNVQYAPFITVNTGLMRKPKDMAHKLGKYNSMLFNELKKNPLDCGSWVALGLQCVNDGQMAKAETCYERACMCAGTAFLPYKEYAYHLGRKSNLMFKHTFERLGPGHPFHKVCFELIEKLESVFPLQSIIDTGEFRPTIEQDLPDFPYDRIEVDEKGTFFVKPIEIEDAEDRVENKCIGAK